MPRLIKGTALNPEQRRQVLSAFIYRLTTENGYPNRNPYKARVAAITDTQWLKTHAFYFLNNGSRLALTHKPCEPAYIAT